MKGTIYHSGNERIALSHEAILMIIRNIIVVRRNDYVKNNHKCMVQYFDDQENSDIHVIPHK